MADINAFNGYRYVLSTPDSLAQFAAPPYDMVDDVMIDDLCARDERNVIRLTQNKPLPTDTANRDRHRRAAALLNEWIAQGHIRRDPQPGIYGYRQTFTIAGTRHVRTGLLAIVRLVDYSKGVVQPHEYTLSGPKIDRYELLEELKFDTGLIFGIVPDDGVLCGAIQRLCERPCSGRFVDRDEVCHELFIENDPAAIAHFQTLMAGRSILIADGHHRYETALAYSQAAGTAASGHVMMSLVSMADPGLVIRPFHRLVKRNDLTARCAGIDDCRRFFDCTPLGAASLKTVTDFIDGTGDWEMLYHDLPSNTLFGLTTTIAAREHLAAHPNGMSEQWNSLNVSRINLLAVQGIMGHPLDGHILHDVMDYVNDVAVAFARVSEDQLYRGAFYIRPIDIMTVKQIVAHGERMPQKSTNFFPKLYSGLAFYSLAD